MSPCDVVVYVECVSTLNMGHTETKFLRLILSAGKYLTAKYDAFKLLLDSDSCLDYVNFILKILG
jgi:hypothetical protein